MRHSGVAWIAVLLTLLLWLAPLLRLKVPKSIEFAFYGGALLLPVFGALFALLAIFCGPPRAASMGALCANLLLLTAYIFLVGAPVS